MEVMDKLTNGLEFRWCTIECGAIQRVLLKIVGALLKLKNKSKCQENHKMDLPIILARYWWFVLLWQNKMNKIFITHFSGNFACKFPRNLYCAWIKNYQCELNFKELLHTKKILNWRNLNNLKLVGQKRIPTSEKILSTILYVNAWFPYLIRFSLSIKKSWSVSSSQNLQYMT